MATDQPKRRAAARGWVTRTTDSLTKLLADPEVDKIALKDAIDVYDKRIDALDTAQSEFELTVDEDKLEQEINSAADFREKSRVTRIEAAKRLASMTEIIQNTASTGAQSANRSRPTVPTSDAKLPKLELPTFNGKVTEWPSFWDQFTAIIHKSSMPDINKFSYLRSLVKDEAKLAIEGLSLTAADYKIACDILSQRYGRKEQIVFAHIQELLNLSVPNTQGSRVANLWKLYNELQAHIRSLEALNVNGEQYGVILTPLILSRLPQDLRLEWAREGTGHESDLEWLLKFLQTEINRRERSQVFKDSKLEQSINTEKKKPTKAPTAAALPTVSQNNNKCAICKKQHVTERCWDLTKVPISVRREKIRNAGLCFRCLSKSHLAQRCERVCVKCNGKHHALLCNPEENRYPGPKVADSAPESNEPKPEVETATVPFSGMSYSHDSTTVAQVRSKRVLLQCVPVTVNGRKCNSKVNVLFDTGSDSSYITSNLVNKVEPEWVSARPLTYAVFGNASTSKSETRNVFQVKLQGLNEVCEPILATEVPVICAPLFRPEVPAKLLRSFGDIAFADDYSEGKEVKIDVLVGLDFYWKLVKSSMVSLGEGLVAHETLFGWMVSGYVQNKQRPPHAVSHRLFVQDLSESCVRDLWELDSIGITDNENPIENTVLKTFNEEIDFQDGRYVVSLPWKTSGKNGKLLNNESLARKRLESLSRKLSADPGLNDRYHEAISDMEASGVIHEVPVEEMSSSSRIFYLPHRPVVREQSVSTKVRPVFDASATGHNGVSLNELLETGPSLIPNLVEILIRFRRWKVALIADIQKAFLQIKVRKEDQDVHRFLWNDNNSIRVMRFDRVPFGNRSSPFLLNATIKHHLARYPTSRVVSELQDNLYVDDWLSGADDETEACQMLQEATKVMGEANMPLAKFESNSGLVSEFLHLEFQDKHLEGEVCKVLGLKWSPVEDCFSFASIDLPPGLVITKRVVLSFIARLFDPVGFLTPFAMVAKCMFQDLWKLGLKWDEPVPEACRRLFTSWLDGLDMLREWKIPRSYTGGPWSEIVKLQLHGFGDASEKAYGSCVYLRALSSGGTWTSTLVFSKAKVAPLKTVTLPRLELLGSLLTARLVVFVQKALRLAEVETYCWTDSMVALSWIKGDSSRWKTFVRNRVSEIQGLTDPAMWNHCSGTENPADITTRPVLAEQLMDSDLWLRGPEWLLSGENQFSGSLCSVSVLGSLYDELEKPEVILTTHKTENVFKVERWSSFTKSIRVVGWLRRFLHNVRENKSKRQRGDLSFAELSKAKECLFACVQEEYYSEELASLKSSRPLAKTSSLAKLSPFTGSDGLLRVQGRLQGSQLTYDEKHPIILPKCWLSLLLVRFHHVFLKHAGVGTVIVSIRNHYWIRGLRRLVKQVKRECVACKRLDAPSCQQPMAPLPDCRIQRTFPFAVTGIDHTGPLYCADHPGKKFYILLFTCAVVRGVHLELVDSLSCRDTTLAVRRFFARRGICSIMYSDNAKGFKATQKVLQVSYGSLCPEWRFLVPRAPWWGGWWERLMRPIKSALRKSLGTRVLTRTELETVLHEVEACLNSRPLTFVGDEVDTSQPLTPAHFLIGRTSSYQPTGANDQPVTNDQLRDRKEIVDHQVDKFWSRWSSEYLRNLPNPSGSKGRGQVCEGSVVLIREDGCPRLLWPMGIVTQTFPGKDGVVRAVQIKTKRSDTITRPIQRLHNLEVTADSTQSVIIPQSTADSNIDVKTSRYGRLLRPRVTLDV